MMSIEAGVQFLLAKVPIRKGFHIPFNESRLYGNLIENGTVKNYAQKGLQTPAE